MKYVIAYCTIAGVAKELGMSDAYLLRFIQSHPSIRIHKLHSHCFLVSINQVRKELRAAGLLFQAAELAKP